MKIGACGKPDITKSLNAYIEAEDKAAKAKFASYFQGMCYPYDDDYYEGDYDVNYMAYYDDMADRMQRLSNGDNDKSESERFCKDHIDYAYEPFDSEYYAQHRLDKKYIYFYPNIYLETSRKRFDTLYDFNEFCNKNDYLVTDTTINEIMKRECSHCCLDPDDLEAGDKVIVADNSYGALLYSVDALTDDLYD